MMARLPSVEDPRKKVMSGLPDPRRTLAFFHQIRTMKIIFP
jgi:hypothetical protein